MRSADAFEELISGVGSLPRALDGAWCLLLSGLADF